MMYKLPYFANPINADGVVYENFTLYFESCKYGFPVEADNLEDALVEIEQYKII